VDVVDSEAVHFRACVDDLARADPLFVRLLSLDERLDFIDIGEVFNFEGVARVDFLRNRILDGTEARLPFGCLAPPSPETPSGNQFWLPGFGPWPS